jgi:HSP20 family protein
MLIQWKNTSDPFFAFNRQVDGLFRELFPAPKAKTRRHEFALDENDAAFTLRASLPGMSSEDLSLEVENGTLKLSAKRSTEVPEGYTALRRERGALSFERSFRLGSKVDAEAIEAKLEHGVLTITLPKRAEQKPRQISIQAA